ncbi:MAG: NAD-dependent deacetylase [Candidatus Bathyarchaeia archaeon]
MRGYERFMDDPKAWWEKRSKGTTEPRRELGRPMGHAKPNPGHYALAELEEMGLLKALITQNIDNLHNAAGSRNVIEIHGNSYKLRCTSCQSRFDRETFRIEEIPPRCPECGGVIKSDTVMFGEPIPPDVLRHCYEETSRCDCLLDSRNLRISLPRGLPTHRRQTSWGHPHRGQPLRDGAHRPLRHNHQDPLRGSPTKSC